MAMRGPDHSDLMSKSAFGRFADEVTRVGGQLTGDELREWAGEMVAVNNGVGESKGGEEPDTENLPDPWSKALKDFLELTRELGFHPVVIAHLYHRFCGDVFLEMSKERQKRLINETLELFEQHPKIVKAVIDAAINDAQLKFLLEAYRQRANEAAGT